MVQVQYELVMSIWVRSHGYGYRYGNRVMSTGGGAGTGNRSWTRTWVLVISTWFEFGLVWQVVSIAGMGAGRGP